MSVNSVNVTSDNIPEKSNARVHGIICDSTTTNRKMWDKFGISENLKYQLFF